MSAPSTGRCLCGEIEYRLNGEPVTYYACHCTNCQKRSGTAFALSLWVKRNALEVTKGEPVLRTTTGVDGAPRQMRECAKCGTRLWSERPELASLRPGTLDDPRQFTPVAHIWTRSKQPWVQIPGGVAQYEAQAGGFDVLVRLWRERTASPGTL